MARKRGTSSSSSSSHIDGMRKRIAAGWSPPVAHLVGFRLEDIGKGRATIRIDVGQQHANPMGTLHGGILCDIADAAMGMAYVTRIAPEESFTTIELKINYLRPVWTGRLTARGRVIRKGRTMGLLECRVTDDQRRLVAFATSTCLTLPGQPGTSFARPRRS
ncbi:MAG: PaaI family thioesterase [Thermoplasmata archaeon]